MCDFHQENACSVCNGSGKNINGINSEDEWISECYRCKGDGTKVREVHSWLSELMTEKQLIELSELLVKDYWMHLSDLQHDN